MENRKFIKSLSEDEKSELDHQATEVYARHEFSGHRCSVWVDGEKQWLYVRLATAPITASLGPLYVLGHDEADLAMERIDLFFEREARNARMAVDQRTDLADQTI